MFLIDHSPDRAADKRECEQQRVREMNDSEDQRDEQDALPTRTSEDLRATIDVRL